SRYHPDWLTNNEQPEHHHRLPNARVLYRSSVKFEPTPSLGEAQQTLLLRALLRPLLLPWPQASPPDTIPRLRAAYPWLQQLDSAGPELLFSPWNGPLLNEFC